MNEFNDLKSDRRMPGTPIARPFQGNSSRA